MDKSNFNFSTLENKFAPKTFVELVREDLKDEVINDIAGVSQILLVISFFLFLFLTYKIY